MKCEAISPDESERCHGCGWPIGGEGFDAAIAFVNENAAAREVVERHIRDGTSVRDARDELFRVFAAAGKLRPSNPEVQQALLSRSLRAYSASGRETREEAADTFPFWQWRTVGDPQVRMAHRALDGKVFQWNDALWARFYPPTDPWCRCTVIALTRGQARERELVTHSMIGVTERGDPIIESSGGG
jgi:SPP1 gp7 family putative phage head morphogenesis protein